MSGWDASSRPAWDPQGGEGESTQSFGVPESWYPAQEPPEDGSFPGSASPGTPPDIFLQDYDSNDFPPNGASRGGLAPNGAQDAAPRGRLANGAPDAAPRGGLAPNGAPANGASRGGLAPNGAPPNGGRARTTAPRTVAPRMASAGTPPLSAGTAAAVAALSRPSPA